MKVSAIDKVYYPVIAAYVLWTLWCVIMSIFPSISGEDNILRAVVRIGVVLIPALIYLHKAHPGELLKCIGFRNQKKGLLWGLSASAILLQISIHLLSDYHLPTGWGKWLNWIILSPFAEEVLFRCVLFTALKEKMGLWKSILISSFFFVLIHLPPILILQTMTSPLEILSYCGHVFLLSIFFTYFFHRAKSIWGSLLPHWVNNLVSLGG